MQKNTLYAIFSYNIIECCCMHYLPITHFRSCCLPLFQSESWYETIQMKNTQLISFEWLCTKTRFETEANSNFGNGPLAVHVYVRRHYLFQEAYSLLLENCEFPGTDNVQGQISKLIFKAKWRLLSNIFRNVHLGNITEYSPVISGEYSVM